MMVADDVDDNDEDDDVFDSGNDSSAVSTAAAVKSKRRSQSLNALMNDAPSELQSEEAEALVSEFQFLTSRYSLC